MSTQRARVCQNTSLLALSCFWIALGGWRSLVQAQLCDHPDRRCESVILCPGAEVLTLTCPVSHTLTSIYTHTSLSSYTHTHTPPHTHTHTLLPAHPASPPPNHPHTTLHTLFTPHIPFPFTHPLHSFQHHTYPLYLTTM